LDLEKLLGKATEALSVGRAFGAPIERGDVVIIPVAWVAGGGGGGGANDGGEDAASGEEPAQRGKSVAGGGGGFGGFTWPLGVYVVKNGEVRWVPAVDATRIALAGIALVGTVAKLRTIRRARSHG